MNYNKQVERKKIESVCSTHQLPPSYWLWLPWILSCLLGPEAPTVPEPPWLSPTSAYLSQKEMLFSGHCYCYKKKYNYY